MPYSTQWNASIRKSTDIFVAGEKRPGGPRDLLQLKPGGIGFAVWISGPAELKFSTEPSGPASQVRGVVVIESDLPDNYRKEYPVVAGAHQRIDLSGIRGRPARIALQALGKLGGGLTWRNPTILERSSSLSETQRESLQNLRKRSRDRNVLMILLDAARFSHFGFAGYAKPTTPHLDGLARESVVFDVALAPASYTLASTGSLFTGLYPLVHGVYLKNSALQESFKTLAESFWEGGWDTGLFSANPNVSAHTGYDQGFRYVWDKGRRRRVDAHEIADAVMDWLDTERQQKFFAYVHFREPHAPYIPPEPYLLKFGGDPGLVLPALDQFPGPDDEIRRQAMAAYEGNLAYVDAQVGRIMEHLNKVGLRDNTVIVMLSDHGEAFWEHGRQGHNWQVYDEMIRIPLVIHIPQEERLKGVRKSGLAGSQDIFPTLVDLLGLSGKGLHHQGRSLLQPLFSDAPDQQRLLLSHNSDVNSIALRSDMFKFISNDFGHTREELYRLNADPGESRNVLDDYPITAWVFPAILQREMDAQLREGRILRAGQERKAVIDREMEEQLRALGYIQ